MQKKNSFKVSKRKVIFSKGPIHLVDCNVRMPGGRMLSRQVLEHPGSVVIVPSLGQDGFLLIRQFRFAVRTWLWEIPAGGIEPGESLRQSAQRELAEETGFKARRLIKLLDFFPTPGISGEKMHLFVAEGLLPAAAEKDEDEEIEIHKFSGSEIEGMIQKGRIADAKTILAFYYLKNFRL